MTVTILGNSAGGPFHGRHYTAQFVQVGNSYFLVDCGEGTQMQIFKYRVKIDRCNQIFISHLHGDHVFGLIGLITNWCLKKRTTPLQLFSPPGLQELITTTIRVCGVRLTYPLEFHEVDASVSAKVMENNMVEVWTIPLNHRTPTSGWLFREKPKPRNIRPEILEEYGIATDFAQIKALKAGVDLLLPDGRRIPNQALTLDPPLPRSYAFCSDTAPDDTVAAVVQGVDLLYHEATFTEENVEEALIAYHATARQAAGIARKAKVGKLIFGHISGRYADEAQHLLEAREIFENSEVAVEGVCYEVGQVDSREQTPSDLYALIGWPLGHSFSKQYFSEKFRRENIADARYTLFPLEQMADFPALLAQYPALKGLNVTIPYKEKVLPFLDALDETARAVGAVNCIKVTQDHRLIGYNTDVFGFETSLKNFLQRHAQSAEAIEAYILGTGGASKAVAYVLQQQNIPFQFVSRSPVQPNEISYDALSQASIPILLINCTPLGTFPKVDEMPPIPLEILKPGNLVFDLVYNPAETLLLRHARARGCFVQNGLDMLHLQAEAAWEIWQT